MAKARKSAPEELVAPIPPTVTIYQHGEHVAGVVQQLFNRPLVVDEATETEATNSQGESRQHDGGGTASGEAKVPFVGALSGEGTYGYQRGSEQAQSTTTRASQNFVYSQAYYLNVVRNALRECALLRTVATSDDARALKPGMFVEYQAEFSPSELTTLMDVVTPELVGTITRTRHMKEAAKTFIGYGTFEETQVAALSAQVTAEADADLAAAITVAVKTDFRSTHTREYYGTIHAGDSPVVAVTICDAAHFTVDDEDRILDGTYTVLGKVTSAVETDTPILRRNKLLSRIKPEGVDAIAALLAGFVPDVTPGNELAEHLDLTFTSRVSGESFRVVPLAIYL